MDIREIRSLDDNELEDAIIDQRERLFNFRFQKESGELEDTNLLRYAKRDLARLLTVRGERNREE